MVKKNGSPRRANTTPKSAKTEQADSLRILTTQSQERPRSRLGTRVRNYFLTGLVIAGPVGITLYIIWSFINLIDAWVKPLVPAKYLPETYLPFTVPGVGLIFSMTAIMLIGFFAANLFGRTLVGYGEVMLDRMPVVRNVYRALKQIFETVLSKSSNSFQQVGLIEYPRQGLLAIVFISTETTGEVRDKADDGEGALLSVFLPTTPNPTSGFLLFVPQRDITMLDMSVEEAAKLVISAGLVVPDHQARLQDLAERAGAEPEVETAAESAAETDAETKPKPVAETTAKTEAETKPKPVAETAAKTEAETKLKPVVEAAAETEAEAKPKPVAETAAETESETKPKPRPRPRRRRQSAREPV